MARKKNEAAAEAEKEVKAAETEDFEAAEESGESPGGEPAKKDEETKNYIYVGCSIPMTVLTYGKIFFGEIPEAVKGLIKERYPEAAPLLIDVRELAEFKRKAAVKGTLEYMQNEILKTKIKGGKK